MIALETSSMIAFLSGNAGADVDAVRNAIALRQAVFPPIVVTELLSDPKLDPIVAALVQDLRRLEILENYWQRAGGLRAEILRRGFKAHLADTLIAQSCLDHDVPLITRDRDFRHFARYAGLRLR
jgi:predicted nucleic acid-binding protein